MTNFSRFSLVILLILIASIALFALMPLSAAARILGISARHVQGTIISGSLRDASLGKVMIGDVNVGVRLLPLVTGQIGFDISRGDSPYAPGVSGAFGSSLNGIFAEKLTVMIDGGSLIKGIDGSEVRLEQLSFVYANGKCHSASGIVRLSLDETVLGSALRGGMIGNAECRGGDLFFPLLSQSNMERAFVRLKGNGSYQLTFTVNDPSSDNAVALSLAGFQPVAGGMRLVRSGTLD